MNTRNPGPRDELSPAGILEMAAGFRQSRILLTAFELGLFTVLGDESKPSADVAEAIGAAHRATDRLMNALCALGLLEKREGRFCNSPAALRFLVEGKPDYMANLMHAANLWHTWSTLTEAVRRGKSVLSPDSEKASDESRTAFITAMHHFARKRAAHVVAELDLSGVLRVLDIGGGSGAYSMAFVRAKKGIKATAFDLPSVVPLTTKYIEEENLSDEIEVVAGDYNADELGSGFDLAFLSSIIHANSFEENRALIQKAAGALNRGGQVVVQDFIMDEDRANPPMGAVFALNMLVNTEAGDTYTESEVRQWMMEAGLAEIVRKETDFDAGLIIGRLQ